MAEEDVVNDGNWVFYKDREEWSDVTPVAQDDGPYSVVAIAYSPKFKDVFDYFRGILRVNEKSPRALALTEDALELNPANYTVWQYRRDILKEINADLKEELRYLDRIIEDNPKNYQVWHHRSVIVDWLQDPSDELPLTERVLSVDPKNYHSWQHRQWVMRTFKLFDGELEYVDSLLQQDVRNNSAWNQRYFVINNTTDFTPSVLKRELSYTMDKIRIASCNESAWNYLRGLLIHHDDGISGSPVVQQFCEELYNAGNRSPYLLGFLIDLYMEEVEKGADVQLHKAQRSIQICAELAKEHDSIRSNYWNHIGRKIEQRLIEINGSMT